MPVLLIALLALAVFGVIGVLLLTAVLETKAENKHNGAALDWLAVRRSNRSHAGAAREKSKKMRASV